MVIVQEVGECPFLDQKGGMAAAVLAFRFWQSEADLRKPAEAGIGQGRHTHLRFLTNAAERRKPAFPIRSDFANKLLLVHAI